MPGGFLVAVANPLQSQIKPRYTAQCCATFFCYICMEKSVWPLAETINIFTMDKLVNISPGISYALFYLLTYIAGR